MNHRLLSALVTCSVLVVAATATAHQFRPSVLRVDIRTDAPHSVTWKTDGADPRAIPGTDLRFGEGCEAELSTSAVRTERVDHFRVACGDAALVIVFPAQPIEVVLDVRADGVPRLVERRGTLPSAFDVSALIPAATTDDEPSNVGIRSWVRLGLEHILFGWDHLCFVLALAFLLPSPRRVAGVVTGFTLGHTVTLIGATLDWVPRPGAASVEAVIALSILYLAVELTRGPESRERFAHALGFPVATGFGLVHGFGFASALSEFALPEGARVAALLAFNVGVELGQLAVVAAALLLYGAARRVTDDDRQPTIDRVARYVTAYVVGGVSVYWLTQRTLALVGV